MVHVNVADVPRKRICDIEPSLITAAQVLNQSALKDVILIVVMGNDRVRSFAVGRLVIRVDFSVSPPSVFVRLVAPGGQAVFAAKDLTEVARQSRIIGLHGGNLGRRPGRRYPGGRANDSYRTVSPLKASRSRLAVGA